jgi:hypothetical protein
VVISSLERLIMYNCEIEFANLTFNWRFLHMAPALPAPFTETFGALVKGLTPFGITPRSVNLESQGTNLEDAAIAISLLGKVVIRFTYSGFDVDARDLYPEDVLKILQILEVVFDTLVKIDPEIKKGTGTTKASLHLKFLEGLIEDYISERVSASVNHQYVRPEAAVFVLDFDEITKQFPTRITIAKSIAFDNGLFLEIAYQIGEPSEEFKAKEPIKLLEQLAEHYRVILSTLDLNLVQNKEVS